MIRLAHFTQHPVFSRRAIIGVPRNKNVLVAIIIIIEIKARETHNGIPHSGLFSDI